MGLLIYLNGKFVEEEDAKISIFDHGLLYGDGVFEGIRGYNGRIFKLDEHLTRLYNSAKGIMLEVPLNFYDLKNVVIQTVRANKLKDSYIRIVVTRGVGDLGLDPNKCKIPTLFIIASSIQLYQYVLYEKGLDVITVGTKRNMTESINPAIKSLNYLNNIMAKIEANGLMLNEQGYISECTGENIFAVKGNVLLTPPLYAGVLGGITRDTIIEIAGDIGLTVKETNMTRYDIYTAEECFLTGTAAEIVPVISLDKRTIGSGKPGKITGKIKERFLSLTRVEGVPVYE